MPHARSGLARKSLKHTNDSLLRSAGIRLLTSTPRPSTNWLLSEARGGAAQARDRGAVGRCDMSSGL